MINILFLIYIVSTVGSIPSIMTEYQLWEENNMKIPIKILLVDMSMLICPIINTILFLTVISDWIKTIKNIIK